MRKMFAFVAALFALSSAPALAVQIVPPPVTFTYAGTVTGTVDGTTPFSTNLVFTGGEGVDSGGNPLLVGGTATTPLTGTIQLGDVPVTLGTNPLVGTLLYTFTSGLNSISFAQAFNLTGNGSATIAGGSFVYGGHAISIGAGVGQITQAIAGAVPEPATWAMMLLGFGAIGIATRRKRTSALVRG